VKLKAGFRPERMYVKPVNEDSDVGNEADCSQALSQMISEKKDCFDKRPSTKSNNRYENKRKLGFESDVFDFT